MGRGGIEANPRPGRQRDPKYSIKTDHKRSALDPFRHNRSGLNRKLTM
jgi:hypothetical protein